MGPNWGVANELSGGKKGEKNRICPLRVRMLAARVGAVRLGGHTVIDSSCSTVHGLSLMKKRTLISKN